MHNYPYKTMTQYNIIATSAFGLESILSWELRDLGYHDLQVENGRVAFRGGEDDIMLCNVRLRTADRILIRMAQFTALDFEELFQGVLAVPWEEIIPLDGFMHVTGSSRNSKLFSVRDCQSITKKAVVEAMKRKHTLERFPEQGPTYKIDVSLVKDTATVTLDTTGPGLHKRGYRQDQGEAPLKETLAAAMVMISRWDPDRVLADPFCGSGTIPIEAALMGLNIAPGLNRTFTCESWPGMPARAADLAREEARDLERKVPLTIYGSDHDRKMIRQAMANADRAGVEGEIVFQTKPVHEFSSKKRYGCVVTNPPYGERMGEKGAAEDVYAALGELRHKLEDWSWFVLTAHPGFEKHFTAKADKNRKLYNGKIKCYLHQYLGPLPGKKSRE